MGNLLPSFGKRALPMLDMPKLAGRGNSAALKLVSYVYGSLQGTSTVTVPKGVTEVVGFARGAGASGGGTSGTGLSGGGGAEEYFAVPVKEGDVFSYTIGNGGAQNRTTGVDGQPTLVTLPNGTIVTAQGGSASGPGGVASATGVSGAVGKNGNGGAAGSFSVPTPGGAVASANPGSGNPGTGPGAGGGRGTNSGGGAGGDGAVFLLLKGP